MTQPTPNRLRFRDAWQALQRLRHDPDNTRAVFEIIDALAGSAEERAFHRFRQSPTGQRVLAEQRDILPLLRGRDRLLALPAGTLGREYAEFTTREQLSADGLVEASMAGRSDRPLNPDRRRFSDRVRDTHDLTHVVSGYGRDLRGEAALLAFGLAQAWSHGVGLIVAMATFEGDAEERRLIRQGWQRGRRAAWLAAADWEALLAQPLAAVRETLGVGTPPVYEPLWSAAAPAAA